MMGDPKKDRTEYFKSYYEDHREELSQKRQDRYRSDPEYRERAKQAAREYRQKKKDEKARLRAEGKLPEIPRAKGPRKPTSVVINGDVHLAYTITIVASRLNRSVNTLNYWTKMGLLPVTPIRSKCGDRLYTDGMILIMQMAILRRGKVSLGDSTFKGEIEAGWQGLGVFAG